MEAIESALWRALQLADRPNVQRFGGAEYVAWSEATCRVELLLLRYGLRGSAPWWYR